MRQISKIVINEKKLSEIIESHRLYLIGDASGVRADLHCADLSSANLSYADLRCADLDFSCLPLCCKGLNFTIDECLAKQLVYHVINLMKKSKISTQKIFKKNVFKWLKDSHLVTKHSLPVLKDEI